jgi:hypothetical protein
MTKKKIESCTESSSNSESNSNFESCSELNSGSDSSLNTSSEEDTSYPPNSFTIDDDDYIEKFENDLCIASGKLAIGEYRFYGEKVKPGYYSLFRVDDGGLIVAPKGTTEEELLLTEWNILDYNINVEGGTFGFCDSKFIEIVNSCKLDSENYIEIGFEYSNACIDQYKDDHDWMELTGKIIKELCDNKNDKLNKWIKKNNLENSVIGFFANNRFGDGNFSVYRGIYDDKDMFLISSYVNM